MAYATQYQTPDLASVLKTLAAFAPPNPSPPQQQQQQQDQPPPSQYQQQPPDYELEEGEYDPSDFQPLALPTTYAPQSYPPQQPQSYQPPPPSITHHLQPQQPPHTPHPQQPLHPAPPHPQHPPQPKPPPSKAPHITTYPPALRHTTTLLTTFPHHTTRIRHLITTAHAHERQWYTGRQNLLKKLAGRKEARARLSVVLASFGTGGVAAAGVNDGSDGGGQGEGGAGEGEGEEGEEAKRELRLYDRKVWKAYGEMVRATERELRGLGIPFFCIDEGLVVHECEKGGKGEGGGEGKVGEKELEVLKGRMVGLLEDLVAE